MILIKKIAYIYTIHISLSSESSMRKRFRRDYQRFDVIPRTRIPVCRARAHADRNPAIREPWHNVAPRALRFVTMP